MNMTSVAIPDSPAQVDENSSLKIRLACLGLLVLLCTALEMALWSSNPSILRSIATVSLLPIIAFACWFIHRTDAHRAISSAGRLSCHKNWRPGAVGHCRAVHPCWSSIAILIGSWAAPNFNGIIDKSFLHWMGVKFPTVTIQQLMLHLIMVPLAYGALRSRSGAVIVSAALFAVFHAPNVVLMILTMTAGVVWVSLFIQYRNLVGLIASHFALAVLVAGVGGEYVLNMRVGATCMELLPHEVESQDRTIVVFPRSVIGHVDELSQRGDRIRVTVAGRLTKSTGWFPMS